MSRACTTRRSASACAAAALAFAEVGGPRRTLPGAREAAAGARRARRAHRAGSGARAEIEAAAKAKDQARWDALVDTVGTHWEAMGAAYLKSAVNPDVNARIAKAIAGMIKGGH